MFYLKQYDFALLSFDIYDDPLEGQKCHILNIDENVLDLIPHGMKLTDAGVMSWLRSRIIPKNREFVDTFLAKNGLSHSDTRGILRISRGLSLNDSYWVTEDDFDGKFSDFNLFEHDFVKVLSLIAYTGDGTSRASGFTSSPEFTTAGMLRKGWRRKDGKIMLYKGGTSGAANAGNEPYSEFYASQIAERMELEHVSYGLSKWKSLVCSTCELFCDIDHSYVPMYRMLDNCTLRTVADYLRDLGEEYYDRYVDMLIFDALIYNEDRHFGNFGLMIDNKTNKPYAFSPIFDNGISLFNYAMPSDFQDLDSYAKTRTAANGIPFENIVREFITPRQKQQLRRMIGFEFKSDNNYNLPKKRLKAIEKKLQKRIEELISIPIRK